jgi:hypothetical protein
MALWSLGLYLSNVRCYQLSVVDCLLSIIKSPKRMYYHDSLVIAR